MSFRLWLSHSTSCSCWHWHVSTGNAKEVCLIGHFGGLCCCSLYLSMHMEGMEGPRTEPCHQIYVTAMDIKFLWLKVVLTETEHCIRSGRLSSQASQHKLMDQLVHQLIPFYASNGSISHKAPYLNCLSLPSFAASSASLQLLLFMLCLTNPCTFCCHWWLLLCFLLGVIAAAAVWSFWGSWLLLSLPYIFHVCTWRCREVPEQSHTAKYMLLHWKFWLWIKGVAELNGKMAVYKKEKKDVAEHCVVQWLIKCDWCELFV